MVKKKDFIELEYTGKLKEDNQVFATTDKKLAEQNGLRNSNSVILPLGEGLFLKGLEDALEGKSLGKHTIELAPEQAFGKKSTRLIKLIPTSKLRQQKIQPAPGMQLNIDGVIGTVRTVSGGRTIVDFNHPLSGREVIYEVDIKRIVADKKEQVKSVLDIIGVPVESVTIEKDKAKVKTKEKLPEDIQKEISKKVNELTGVNVDFS